MAGRRGLVALFVLALPLAACSSKSPTPHAGGSATSPAATASAAGCAGRAGLSGQVSDHGSGTTQGGSVSLDAGDFFFSPTCVTGSGTITVTLKNTGTALHNISITSLKIDKDIPAGQTVTVTVKLPTAGALPFFCKYHVASGMQGAFIAG